MIKKRSPKWKSVEAHEVKCAACNEETVVVEGDEAECHNCGSDLHDVASLCPSCDEWISHAEDEDGECGCGWQTNETEQCEACECWFDPDSEAWADGEDGKCESCFNSEDGEEKPKPSESVQKMLESVTYEKLVPTVWERDDGRTVTGGYLTDRNPAMVCPCGSHVYVTATGKCIACGAYVDPDRRHQEDRGE